LNAQPVRRLRRTRRRVQSPCWNKRNGGRDCPQSPQGVRHDRSLSRSIQVLAQHMHPLLVDGSVVVDEAQDLGLVLNQHLQELGLEVVQAGGQRGVNAMFGLVGGGRWAMGNGREQRSGR